MPYAATASRGVSRLLFLVTFVLVGQSSESAAPSDSSTQDQNVSPCLVRFEQDGKYGYRTPSGEVAVPPTYDDARDFAYGLAPVNKGATCEFGSFKSGGKWGYIDVRGTVVVPFDLGGAREFSDGLALVYDEQGSRYIDTQGKTVFKVGHVSCGDFSEGLASVWLDRSREVKGWRTRYINKTGEAVCEIDGFGKSFHEGLASFCISDAAEPEKRLCGYISTQGVVTIPPTFAEAMDFSEGLAAVRLEKTTGIYGMGDRWGYIDRRGHLVIPARFNETRPFRNGTAWVHVGGGLGSQIMHMPPSWNGGEWLLINKKGAVVESPSSRPATQTATKSA